MRNLYEAPGEGEGYEPHVEVSKAMGAVGMCIHDLRGVDQSVAVGLAEQVCGLAETFLRMAKGEIDLDDLDGLVQ